jgi:hypothetical protein
VVASFSENDWLGIGTTYKPTRISAMPTAMTTTIFSQPCMGVGDRASPQLQNDRDVGLAAESTARAMFCATSFAFDGDKG